MKNARLLFFLMPVMVGAADLPNDEQNLELFYTQQCRVRSTTWRDYKTIAGLFANKQIAEFAYGTQMNSEEEIQKARSSWMASSLLFLGVTNILKSFIGQSWIIEDRYNTQTIGSCRIVKIIAPEVLTLVAQKGKPTTKIGNFGINLLPKYWSKGIGLEVCLGLINAIQAEKSLDLKALVLTVNSLHPIHAHSFPEKLQKAQDVEYLGDVEFPHGTFSFVSQRQTTMKVYFKKCESGKMAQDQNSNEMRQDDEDANNTLAFLSLID